MHFFVSTPDNQINLNNLKYFNLNLRQMLVFQITPGSMAAVIGLGLGCGVFEKHVTQ